MRDLETEAIRLLEPGGTDGLNKDRRTVGLISLDCLALDMIAYGYQ